MGNSFTVPNFAIQPPAGAEGDASTPTMATCPMDFVLDPTSQDCRILCGSGYSYLGGKCQSDADPTVSYTPPTMPLRDQSRLGDVRGAHALLVSNANVRVENNTARQTLLNQRRAEIAGATVSNTTLSNMGSLIQSQQAQFNQSARLIQNTRNALRERRPPVQPDSEIVLEQSKLQKIFAADALFIQITLFLVFLCVVSYLVLPLNMANYVSLAILTVAMIYRFFFVK